MHYTNYGKRTPQTPQTEIIPGREADMAQNNAGGASFKIDDMAQLQRFLVLGSAGGTYYVGARKLTRENLAVVERLLKAGRGCEVVDLIVAISEAGRAPSNDPALFALARCCACDALPSERYTGKDGKEHVRVHPDNVIVRRYAYAALPHVARTGTHILHFMEYAKQFRGDGPAHLRAVRRWYQDKPLEKLAYQALKYQQRDGWSQRDVLRTAHPKALSDISNELYYWITRGTIDHEARPDDPLAIIRAYERAKQVKDDGEIAAIIKEHRLPREAVPTTHLKSVRVWEALLEDMPMEAMLRNLATMTKLGVLQGDFIASVVARLRNGEALRKARLHPVKILAALTTYQQGHGQRSDAKWTPIAEIVDALNDAFYVSFGNVDPTGKRIVLALDVSGSMGGSMINGIPGLSARVGSAAMALITAAVEPHYTIMAFSRGFVPLSITPRLDDVVRAVNELPFNATDCARPMLWAMEHGVEADAFVVYTDSETWLGEVHPIQALAMYRQRFDIPAKLIVVGMTATKFSIADPLDAGSLDVVGFDTTTPSVISDFIKGAI